MDEITANSKKFSRFTKHIILGSLISGVLSATPILNCLNFLFCLINMAGIVLALQMFLKANPEEMLTAGEAAKFGTVAGAGAGLIYGVLNLLISTLFGAILTSWMADLPGFETGNLDNLPLDTAILTGTISTIFIPIYMVVYAGFGALGTSLGMQLLFNKRLRKNSSNSV